MVNSNRREILTYNDEYGFYYRITGCTDIDSLSSGGRGENLKVTIGRPSWQDWQKQTETAEFDIIAGKNVSDEAFSKLTYLTLIGANTGYKVTEIIVDYDHLLLTLEHRSLWKLNIYSHGGTHDLIFGDDCAAGFEISLPTVYLVRIDTLPADSPGTLPTFTVKAPRLKRKKNGKPKWRKFVILKDGTCLVREYHKKYLREIKFLEPTKEQHAAREQPVEICESYL